MLTAAFFGFLLGFFGSIPVAGPLAVLVLSRGLDGRFRPALLIAVGGAVGEAGYAALAFWGFGALLADHSWIEPASRAAGAVILAPLGYLLMRTPKAAPLVAEDTPPPPPRRSELASFLLGFTVTAANPTLIATWTAAVTALFASGLVDFQPSSAAFFALGTALGIAAWSTLLLGLIWKLQKRFRPELLAATKRVTGALVVVLAVFFAWRFVAYFI
ncbi:MAG: LysE family transporter [Myxococcales bacterium]|nr:LysE family transporter [Myxococcales bacterium]